jgi:hypothetical protein
LESFFMNAYARGTAPDNIQSGFRSTGLCPANVSAVLKSGFVQDDAPKYDPSAGEGAMEGHFLLTSAEGLARKEGNGDAEAAIAKSGGSIVRLSRQLLACDPKDAHFLTPFPRGTSSTRADRGA